jgi:hypothetical protein
MRDFLKVVGCYNKAEFIEIFGFENCAKTPFNIFTLIVFQDTNKSNIEEKFLTSNLQSFKNNRNIRPLLSARYFIPAGMERSTPRT